MTKNPASQAAAAARTPGHGQALRLFAQATMLATLGLIFFGGQVKSHDAGLSVPDWPLTMEQNPITYPISEWRGGIFHEHFHRLYAGVVALLTVALAVWLGLSHAPRWLKGLGVLAVAAVLFQALLGGLTVIYQLPTVISASHATLAQTFFVILVIIAYGLSQERAARQLAPPPPPQQWRPILNMALGLIALIYVQLLLGAFMRHTGAGLAIPDFPTVAGNWLPRFNADTVAWVNDWRWEHSPLATGEHLLDIGLGHVALHFAHRVGALVIAVYILFLLRAAARGRAEAPALWQGALLIAGAAGIQITLGILTIWTEKSPAITSLHVMTGAATLGLAVLLALRAWPAAPLDRAIAAEAPAGTAP